MTRIPRLAISVLAALGLAVAPAFADQAVRRPATTSSGAASGASTAGGSTQGGSSSAGAANPRSAGSVSSGEDQARRPPPGAPRTGTATSRSTPPPRSGGSSGSATGRPAGSTASGVSGGSTSSRTGDAVRSGGIVNSAARDRDGRAVTGAAVRRDVATIDIPLFGPWGRWFPYYGTGFGPSFGFIGFNPWGIWGATSWRWYRSGYWYDPYGYYPYGWHSSYGYGGRSPARTRDDRDEGRRMGSIRLKASPRTAMVYIDGALVGTVDEFDGLRKHLQLDEGVYQLELRADGYETYSGDLRVEAGKTLTERVSLKKTRE